MACAQRSTLRITGGVLVLTVLALTGCQTDSEREMAGAAGADTSAATAAPVTTPGTDVAAAGSVTDPEIAAIVVAANSVDIQAGELARERATNEQVRDFAERMITDHTSVNEQAGALVSRLGIAAQDNETSRQLMQDGEQARQRLSQLSGAAFDSAYINHEVMYHQQVLDALDNMLIPGAQNAELRALLEQTRPAIADHLEQARRIQTSLGGSGGA